ncbi:MAG: hypothetical protein WD030_08460 [Pirellulales bacterium]
MARYIPIAPFVVALLIVLHGGPGYGQAVGADGLVPVVRVAQVGGGATFNGTIQPSTGGFDPYADPALQAPSLFPQTTAGFGQQPYVAPQYGAPYPNSTFTTGPQASSPNGSYLFAQPNGQVAYLPRLMQNVRGRYTWINGPGDDDVEWNIIEAEATFLFPFFHSPTPILLSPGGAINLVAGPSTGGGADLPPQLYDLYLDAAWRPQITERLAADLGFRPGIYTDFENFDSEALRYQGRALAAISWTPTVEVRLGAVYLDRVQIQWLPAGGIVWTPDENRRFEFLFPNPKFAWRLSQYGNADFWIYIAGEYGGGSWQITRDSGVVEERVDYNDIRFILGLEWSTPRGLKGMVEVGYLWNRELVYSDTTADDLDLESTFMLRGGLQF